ncbi:E3 ubiquitin-protein ligase BRE1-like 2 isoform X2 [Carica papaya]|uniref:E3 ubiquitin-protein ligase BRE1-like 2 isoform X2 n=1 Tax=Carica papaya TaxID=3649 RepID=UPI000B8C902F|nr:E3 ubiquitin-protein ligase BRE1-like 2 isoform X2 [Carica papaya]
MEDSEPGKPDKKRPHLSSVSPTMARNSPASPPLSKNVDAAVLQHQNQKLVQQLELQKQELHDLETKIRELQDNQMAYDDMLIIVNQLWNQLVDDLILLGVRVGAGRNVMRNLDHKDHYQGSIPSCAAEQMFLCRLLEADSIEIADNEEIVKYVGEALASRHSSTRGLVKCLEDTISVQRAKTENIAEALRGELSGEGVIFRLSKIDFMMEEEAKNLREMIDNLHLKHKEYADGIQAYITRDSVDQSEIKRLAGQLEESMAELEESRRKLINLKMQKDAASAVHSPTPIAGNGNLSPEKPIDKTSLRELKEAIEETKILAADRLSELQEAQDYNLVLSNQLQDLQNEIYSDKYVECSRLYNLLVDKLQNADAELERYRTLTDSLEADRPHVMRREKELNLKAESSDAARKVVDNPESRIQELELQLQRCMLERNELEIRMEEAIQDSGRKDIKTEFQIMASALSKEMGMMESQVKRWKDTAHEAVALREEAQSIEALLRNKMNEKNRLEEECAAQDLEIKLLNAQIEKLQKENLETQMMVDMYARGGDDNRDVMEIRESERRAHLQAEVLKNALDEHSLELRVKAANETEAACQNRLSAAEAEIAQLRAELEASQRGVLELTEAIKYKERESEAYISEIETIGQAYEDMQTQNQRLLEQVADRDQYNIKLVSESVKTKQAQSSLLSEKQALAKQLQQINASAEALKARIAHDEEQMKACLAEGFKFIQEDRHLAISLETAKWDLADAEKEFKWLKSAVSSSEKDYEQIQRKTNDIQTELHDEKGERQKLEEELMKLNAQLAELTSETGEAAILRLQDEIKNCKNILKCGVCFDRPKEVVILKCYHLFCNQCIQRNLEIRHRKCPGCGTAFGQNDVRFVKI